MKIFFRIVRFIKAWINSLIGRAEKHNPKLLLEQSITDMREQLMMCRREVAEAIAEEKKLGKQAFDKQNEAKIWQERAEHAVKKDNDDLAREALARKREIETQAQQLVEAWTRQKTACNDLRNKLSRFNSRIDEANRKKGVLVARHEAAEAQKQIAEAQSSFSNESAFSTFEEMENEINDIEANAAATHELSKEYSGDQLEKRFQEIESFERNDDDLLNLKRSMGMDVNVRVGLGTSPEENKEFEFVEKHNVSKLKA